jgi:2-oxoglutarate dehydrogenase E2 component (dihydrolipoamide succinyltransferase)
MGESIFEGTITKWLKQAGDAVEKDEPLFEISTDKVDAEIPSPVSGVLSEIKFPEGSTVQVNTIVAVVADGSSPAAVAPATPKPVKQAEKLPAAPVPAPLKSTPPPAPAVASGGTQVVMPQMGESIFEGTITRWLKRVGDTVQKDEPLFEISTDKVDAEVPSPVAGILTEIKAEEGATVEVNAVVAVIGGTPGGTSVAQAVQTAAPLASQSQATAVPSQQQVLVAAPQAGRRLRSSPLVRRIAKEHNIDLAYVPGTGSDARITKDDILRYISQPAAQRAAAAPLMQPKAEPPQPKALTAEVVPLTKMRAIIAQRMVESKRISPHVHSIYKVDMTRIVRLREREKAGFEQRTGVKLTYMPFIAVAAIEALRRFPIVNASLVDNFIHYHANINLGIAVALEWGLIVPTVREAEKRSFADLARAINDLAGRARSKKLSPDEVGGSTFTLTNSGVFGDEFGTPIINQPESAILAIGALRKEPVVLTDAEGNDTIAIRSIQHFCLGFDHRLIDGADGGKFMSEFKKTLETWNRPVG